MWRRPYIIMRGSRERCTSTFPLIVGEITKRRSELLFWSSLIKWYETFSFVMPPSAKYEISCQTRRGVLIHHYFLPYIAILDGLDLWRSLRCGVSQFVPVICSISEYIHCRKATEPPKFFWSVIHTDIAPSRCYTNCLPEDTPNSVCSPKVVSHFLFG